MAVSSGIKDEHFAKLQEIIKAVDPGFINLDVSNGYTQAFVEFVKKVREVYPRKTIIAGNVCTSEVFINKIFFCFLQKFIKSGLNYNEKSQKFGKKNLKMP